jgi:asparagine synthase (glutamine-hydrolysing)
MAMAADFQSYLPDDILVKVDRASMLTSLEVRAPFLDYRIIEFAFRSVPNRLRATASERKILPRRLAARLLPRELDLTRKQGFSLPLQSWFKGRWGPFIEDVLLDSAPDLFDPGLIRSLIQGQRRGRPNAERLFSLSLFKLWCREYRVEMA